MKFTLLAIDGMLLVFSHSIQERENGEGEI